MEILSRRRIRSWSQKTIWMRLHFVNIPSRFSKMAVSQHTTILQTGFENFMPQVTSLATIVNNIVAVANNKTKQSKLIIYALQSSLPSLTNLLSYLGNELCKA